MEEIILQIQGVLNKLSAGFAENSDEYFSSSVHRGRYSGPIVGCENTHQARCHRACSDEGLLDRKVDLNSHSETELEYIYFQKKKHKIFSNFFLLYAGIAKISVVKEKPLMKRPVVGRENTW